MPAVAVAGSLGAAAAAAGSVAQWARRRGGFAAGRQLRQAASNGSRCNAFFKFGNKEKEKGSNGAPADAEYWKGVSRDDFQPSDVEDYFTYMGMLASEGSYDRCEAMLASCIPPVDLLLLMACSEGDDGKVEELLAAGANPAVKDIDGRSTLELATKDEIKAVLQAAMAKA